MAKAEKLNVFVMAVETEEYLLNKLTVAVKQAQGSEDCVSKVLFNIQRHFDKVISLLQEAKNGESSRREDLYYLLNALANWQMLLERKRVYSREGIRVVFALSNKLKQMESRYKGDKSTIDVNVLNKISRVTDGKESYRRVYRNRVFGFSERENFMERFLIRRDNEVNGFKAICISGVVGVGKTTLCQLAFNNEQVTRSFFPRIWVCMPSVDDEYYKKEVLKRMLECLGVEDHVIEFTVENRGLLGLLFALRSVLKGTRYLIVLDGAFHFDDFFHKLWLDPESEDSCSEKLALGLPKRQGGAVVITTRSMELAKETVGEENVYPLLPLNDESCWEILNDSAGETVKKFLNDHDIKDTILSKLRGLPLAANIMGEIMKQEFEKMPAST